VAPDSEGKSLLKKMTWICGLGGEGDTYPLLDTEGVPSKKGGFLQIIAASHRSNELVGREK
jgi:hypothetical protein